MLLPTRTDPYRPGRVVSNAGALWTPAAIVIVIRRPADAHTWVTEATMACPDCSGPLTRVGIRAGAYRARSRHVEGDGAATPGAVQSLRTYPRAVAHRVAATVIALIESPQVCSLKFPTCEQRSVYRLASAGGCASQGFGGGVVVS